MSIHDMGSNPWLKDYEVQSPGEPYRYSPRRNQENRSPWEGTGGGGAPPGLFVEQSGPPETPPPGTNDRSTLRQWFKYALVMAVGAVAAALASKTVDFLQTRYENRQSDPPEIPAPFTHEELFAIQVQVRATMEEARNYLGPQHPLLAVFEDWNSPEGLFKHGQLPQRLPAFIPEARPQREDVFNEIVYDGLRNVKIHAFEYRSEDQLYKVAAKCGLPGRVGVRWIRQWSSWRQGVEQTEQTRCKPNGWCILLTNGCDADTFDDLDNRGK